MCIIYYDFNINKYNNIFFIIYNQISGLVVYKPKCKWAAVNDDWYFVVGIIIDSYFQRKIISFCKCPTNNKHVKGNRLPRNIT